MSGALTIERSRENDLALTLLACIILRSHLLPFSHFSPSLLQFQIPCKNFSSFSILGYESLRLVLNVMLMQFDSEQRESLRGVVHDQEQC